MKNLLYIGNKLSKHGKTLTNIETLGPLLEQQGYRLTYASSKKNKALRLFDMIAKTLWFRLKIDVVLIDTYSTVNFWYALIISQLCRVLQLKYIPILHGGNLPKRLKKNPRLCGLLFKHSYKNIAPSGYLLNAFQNRGYAELVFIPNSIEMNNYAFKSRSEFRPKLLWVRSLAPIYNPEMALRVVSLLQKDFPDVSLCMVGPDKKNKKEALQQMAESLKIQVKFTGKLAKTEWLQLSQHYDVFLNTTHFDNMPISVIEAMALGLPVVSTNVGGLPYLLKDNETAFLVNDNDAIAMASAVSKMIRNTQTTQQMTENALRSVQNFDWTVVKTKWNEILN